MIIASQRWDVFLRQSTTAINIITTSAYTPFTRYNRLYRVNKHPTGWTTVLNEQPLFVQPVVKPGCTTGLTTGCIHDTAVCQTSCQMGLTTHWMFVYTIQPVVSCIQTFTRLSNWFDNCQWQSCSAVNCLSSGINILAGGWPLPLNSWLQVTYPLLKAASFDTFCLVAPQRKR